MRTVLRRENIVGLVAAIALVGGVLATAGPSAAQDMLQLTVPASEYTLGTFRYKAPGQDGWRQMANEQTVLSLVYAQQKAADVPDTLDILFGATLEVHDIPESVEVESAAALADLSRKQMAEARKSDVVGISPIEAVPGIDNLYTYRLLVHAPVKEMPDSYEVYYVALAPSKKQYLVIQCITKEPEYGNQLYFNEFYGSLASIRSVVADGSATPTDEGTKANAKPDSEPAAK